MLNSKVTGKGNSSPLSPGNASRWQPIITKAKTYLRTLKMRTKTGEMRFVYETGLHTWVTGLYITLSSVERFVEDVCNERKALRYSNSYKRSMKNYLFSFDFVVILC